MHFKYYYRTWYFITNVAESRRYNLFWASLTLFTSMHKDTAHLYSEALNIPEEWRVLLHKAIIPDCACIQPEGQLVASLTAQWYCVIVCRRARIKRHMYLTLIAKRNSRTTDATISRQIMPKCRKHTEASAIPFTGYRRWMPNRV